MIRPLLHVRHNDIPFINLTHCDHKWTHFSEKNCQNFRQLHQAGWMASCIHCPVGGTFYEVKIFFFPFLKLKDKTLSLGLTNLNFEGHLWAYFLAILVHILFGHFQWLPNLPVTSGYFCSLPVLFWSFSSIPVSSTRIFLFIHIQGHMFAKVSIRRHFFHV